MSHHCPGAAAHLAGASPHFARTLRHLVSGIEQLLVSQFLAAGTLAGDDALALLAVPETANLIFHCRGTPFHAVGTLQHAMCARSHAGPQMTPKRAAIDGLAADLSRDQPDFGADRPQMRQRLLHLGMRQMDRVRGADGAHQLGAIHPLKRSRQQLRGMKNQLEVVGGSGRFHQRRRLGSRWCGRRGR